MTHGFFNIVNVDGYKLIAIQQAGAPLQNKDKNCRDQRHADGLRKAQNPFIKNRRCNGKCKNDGKNL